MEFLRRLLGFQRATNNYVLRASDEAGVNHVVFLGNTTVAQPCADEIQGFMRALQSKNKHNLLESIPIQSHLLFEDQIMTLKDTRTSRIIVSYKLSNIVVSCVYAKDQKILALFYHNEDILNCKHRQTGLECHLFQCASKPHARTLAEKISTSIMSSYLQRQRNSTVSEGQTLAKYVTYENIDDEYMSSDKLRKKQFGKSKSHRGKGGSSKGSAVSTDTSFERITDKAFDGAYSTDTTIDSNATNKCYLTLTPTTTDEICSDNSICFEETESSRAFKPRQRCKVNDAEREVSTRQTDSKQRLQCQRLRHWRQINDDFDLSDSSTSTSNFEQTARIKLNLVETKRRDSVEADVSTIEDSAVEDSGRHVDDTKLSQKLKLENTSHPGTKETANIKSHRGTTIKRESKSEKQRRNRRNRDSNRSKSFTASETLNHMPIQTLSWYGQRADYRFSDSESNKSLDSLRDKANDYVKLIHPENIDDYDSAGISFVAPRDGTVSEADLRHRRNKIISGLSQRIILNPLEVIPCDTENVEFTGDRSGSGCTGVSYSATSDIGGSVDSGLETPQQQRKSLMTDKHETVQIHNIGEVNLRKSHLRKLRNLSETDI